MLQPLGLPVFVSRSKDLRRGEDEAIFVYVTQESLSRSPGGGEKRGGLPISRDMTVEINILTREPGDGSEAAERGDDLSRQVELVINSSAPAMTPLSASQAFHSSEATQCITTLVYAINHLDKMEA